MSQIFDALQRSGAERSSTAQEPSLDVTEILRNAERFASTKWEDTLRNSRVAAIEKNSAELAQVAAPRAVVDTPLDSAVESDPIQAGERISLLQQFKPLALGLTPTARLICYTEKDSPAGEAFRLLGVRLRDIRRTRPLKRILISSSIPQEGKSMVAANLACTLASTPDQKVLLLEGDVRRPALTETFGIRNNPGLCEWLQGESSLMNSIYRLEELGFWIMPAGLAPENPLEFLQSSKLSALLGQLSEWFDTIFIDSPPILPLADTSVWARHSDGILLVTRQGKTEKRQLKRGLEAIDHQKLIGAIMNSSRNLPHSDYYYHSASRARRVTQGV